GRLPPVHEIGYHRLAYEDIETEIAIVPRSCPPVPAGSGGGRPWGIAVQVPSLRGARPEPFGTFGALGEFAVALGRLGGDALAISPVHALFPSDPGRYSPYGPSSRSFLNVLFADPALIGHPLGTDDGQEELID